MMNGILLSHSQHQVSNLCSNMQSKALNFRTSKRQREKVFPPRAYKHIFYNGICLTQLSKCPLPKIVVSLKLPPNIKTIVRVVRENASKSSTHPGGGGTVNKTKLPLKTQSRPVCNRLKVLNQYLANLTKQYTTKPSDIPMPGGWGNPEYPKG